MTLDEFKKYVLMCRRIGINDRTIWSGATDSSKYAGIIRSKDKAIIQGLIEKYYIEAVNAEKSQYKVLVAPRYNGTEFIKNEGEMRDVIHLKMDGNGYIIVPYEIVDNGHLSELSGRELQVLLQLYSYNFFHMYGGVDPNVINLPGTVDITDFKSVSLTANINEHLYSDIYLTRNKFIVTLLSLMRRGLIKVETVVSEYDGTRIQYICDYTTEQKLGAGESLIKVVRPVYQWKGHVEKWNERNKKL